MEIESAISECADRRLQTKYHNATYVIQRAFALYEFEQVAFSFNGGKDSTVLLHLLRAGHYLHKKNSQQPNGDKKDCVLNCPMRTIYFESPSSFPEINSFTYETASMYDLQLEIIRSDFKSGLEDLLSRKPIKAIFIGTRIGDPNAVGQEQFSPSSFGWPPFMRVNPILDWSYRDVWAFISTCKVQYCSLYDKGFTSIGSIYDTVPNPLLCIADTSSTTEKFKPAYLLSDGRQERAGRAKKGNPVNDGSCISDGPNSANPKMTRARMASIIVVGDEILSGKVEDEISAILCKKLHAIGWHVSHLAVVRNEVDSVAEEVEKRTSTNDLVFLFGGVGPLHSDVSIAGVAKAFGTRLVMQYRSYADEPNRSYYFLNWLREMQAPDEEFEEYLRHLIGDHCSGDRNEMALLPEGITELLHHEMLPVPLIKCHNVIILSATNLCELEEQWNCLLELADTPLVKMAPFFSKYLSTTKADVEISQIVSKLCLEFPDLNIGCHRKTRRGPLIIDFTGKDQTRVELAVKELSQRYQEGTFSEANCG